MSDERLRRLERDSATGDPAAVRRLRRELRRQGLDPASAIERFARALAKRGVTNLKIVSGILVAIGDGPLVGAVRLAVEAVSELGKTLGRGRRAVAEDLSAALAAMEVDAAILADLAALESDNDEDDDRTCRRCWKPTRDPRGDGLCTRCRSSEHRRTSRLGRRSPVPRGGPRRRRWLPRGERRG